MNDILKVRGGDYKDYIGIVEWCGTCCLGYRLQFIGIGNNERLADFKDIEVIGNIHENPELLNRPK